MLLPCALAAVLIDRACATGGPPDAVPRSASAAAPGTSAPAYASGACRALPPTGSSRGRTVFVDAGHGGPDPGVLANGRALSESSTTLAVATELARQLRAGGYRVVLSRTADTSVARFAAADLTGGALDATQVRQDLQARVRCANGSGAAVLLSIHFNGYGDPAVGGSQTIYDDARPFATQSKRLAAGLQQALLGQLGLDDRGVITDDQLNAPTLADRAGSYGHLLLLGPPEPGWLDQGTSMPGALVEPLFLTRPAEAAIAATASGQRRIAQALAAALESYLGGAPRQ